MKFLSSRLFITGLLIVIQTGWLVLWFFRLAAYDYWVSMALTIFSGLISLYIINKNENPAYKIAWIFLIAIVPVFGGTLYAAVGNKRPMRKLRRRLEGETRRRRKLHRQEGKTLLRLHAQNPRACATFGYIYRQGKFPVWTNTQTRYFSLGEEMFSAMLQELKKAEHYIFLEYFIIAEGHMWEEILAILEEKARQGLDVRVIYDDVGCLGVLPVGYRSQLEKKGIRCIAFNPFIPIASMAMNNRDHRKILVIDGCVAFSGGINIGDEYINKKVRFGHWKDSGFMLLGEAVWNFTLMFLEMWNGLRPEDPDYAVFYPHRYHENAFPEDGFVQPFSDSPLDEESLAENIYIELLSQAQKYVYIFTPYLVIDNEMQTALCMAAKRGVDVRIVTPGIPDKKTVYQLTRSYYPPLLSAGVRIYEYTPGFLHAKSYVCDDVMAVVGTINLDYRSLYLHFECGTLFYGSQVVKQLKADAQATFASSRQVGLADCRRGLAASLRDAALRVVAPLL